MVGVTTLLVFITFFAVSNGFPLSDKTIVVWKSDAQMTWEAAKTHCIGNKQRLASALADNVLSEIQGEKDNTSFWVAKDKDTKCPSIYLFKERLYMEKNDKCGKSHRFLCMSKEPTDFSLMIYIGVGCMTLAQIILITICAVKFSNKKHSRSESTKKSTPKQKKTTPKEKETTPKEKETTPKEKETTQREEKTTQREEEEKITQKEEEEKTTQKEEEEKTPQKEEKTTQKKKTKKEKKPKKEKSKKSRDKSKKKAKGEGEGAQGTEVIEQKSSEEDGKGETPAAETSQEKQSEEVSKEEAQVQGTEAKEQKSSEEDGKEGKQATDASEQKSSEEAGKEDKQAIATSEQKPSEGESKEEAHAQGTEAKEEKSGDEDGKDGKQGTDTSEQKPSEAAGKEDKEETATLEQKPSETMDKQAGSDPEAEKTTTGKADGDQTVKDEFPAPPEFLLNELTASIFSDTSFADTPLKSTDAVTTGIAGGESADVIPSAVTDSPATDTTCITTSTTASTVPVDDVAITTAAVMDTTITTLFAVTPINADPQSDTDGPTITAIEAVSTTVAISSISPPDDQVTSSGEGETTGNAAAVSDDKPNLTSDLEAMLLSDPCKDDVGGEETLISRPDPPGSIEQTTPDEVDV